jgi:hypothetical protein
VAQGNRHMSIYVTFYDWLMVAGLATNGVAFWLLFWRKP